MERRLALALSAASAVSVLGVGAAVTTNLGGASPELVPASAAAPAATTTTTAPLDPEVITLVLPAGPGEAAADPLAPALVAHPAGDDTSDDGPDLVELDDRDEVEGEHDAEDEVEHEDEAHDEVEIEVEHEVDDD